MPRIDYFFDRQPPLTFLDELRSPMYADVPVGWGTRPKQEGEIDARGMYLATPCLDPLLETSWKSLADFLCVYKIGGDRYPITVSLAETENPESFSVEIAAAGITVAGDREGIRRALVWIEDELRRSEGPYLRAGVTERHAVIRSRITRCFFSPINRPPKFGDELSDDIDYYPEQYLNRLMHDGANGVWIYTRFSDLVDSELFPEWGRGRAGRIEKLNQTIEKCARYGIGVYVFAIEPCYLSVDQAQRQPEIAGIPLGDRVCVCTESALAKKFVYESGKRLMEDAPGLRGFISITYGERPTSCASAYSIPFTGDKCPKGGCPAPTPGRLLADNVDALKAGFHAVNPDCEVISWTYGHRLWDYENIREYVRSVSPDVKLMQNFDDMGYEEQLGVMRQCVDYWLSYVGPSELFTVTADEAQKSGRTMFAKMQICCSHEIASVPYVPVPGIIYKKYAGARSYGVTGIMQCWYFGNYPSMMSKAAGELSFVENFTDEDAFLRELAAIWWGRSRADQVVRAWKCFEASYRGYPMNVMFSYYGPAHDGVVWKLQLEPKNNKLPRTWQTLDPIDGDRIGEALLNGHTLEEACILTDLMKRRWAEGTEILTQIDAESLDSAEQSSVARTIALLFDSADNILHFYALRDRLGRGDGDASALLAEMEQLVRREIENSRRMIPLCEADGRLGYHSEGEGFKFFPEKLNDRIAWLEELLATEFVRVRARIADGLPPLAYYAGEGDGKKYRLAAEIDTAPWEEISKIARFRASLNGMELTIELTSDKPLTFVLCPELTLMWPGLPVHIVPGGKVVPSGNAYLYNSLFGDRLDEEMKKYARCTSVDGVHRLCLDLREFGLDAPRPMKIRITAGGESWVKTEEPFHSLGLTNIIPEEYGWLIP